MGADINLRLEMYEEVIEMRPFRPVLHVCLLTLYQGAADGSFQYLRQITLMLKLDGPLPAHGFLNMSFDCLVRVSCDAPDAPLWLQQVHASWLRPKRSKCRLRLFVNNVLVSAPSEAHVYALRCTCAKLLVCPSLPMIQVS